MGRVGFNIVFTITPCRHLHWIIYKTFVEITTWLANPFSILLHLVGVPDWKTSCVKPSRVFVPRQVVICFNLCGMLPVADPGFPHGGGANSPRVGGATYDFAKMSQKLHEIEKIWSPGGWGYGGLGERPLRSTNSYPWISVLTFVKTLKLHY